MGYTMEQLVKALAAETMSEIEMDEAIVEPEVEDSAPGMWEHIAKVTIDEIESMFGEQHIHPYGYYADEVVYTMRPLLEPYSAYPATHKLLTAIEEQANSCGKDPRAYVNLVLRIFDNDSAREWKNKRAFR